MTDLLASMQAALGLPTTPIPFSGEGALPSAFAVTELACASIAVAGQASAALICQQTGRLPPLEVDRRLASFWFATSLRPIGWSVPPMWDPVAGDYATADGWIRLHTNAPHHRLAAEKVLGPCLDRADMASKVARWNKTELEQAVVDAGGCAAEMRSALAWQAHPQGRAVSAEPLVHFAQTDEEHHKPWLGSVARPLAGLKVLDLTRVLAGPIASRFLAGLGADVLRIDPPTWDEPGVVPEVTLGKRCARLDLQQPDDRATFEALLKDADILLHGYRADALERLGYGAGQRHKLAPGLIDVSLNAYGWSGPWQNRRGFDSLVQMSSGIAEAGMGWKHAGQTDTAAGTGAGSRHRLPDGGERHRVADPTPGERPRWFGTPVTGTHGQAVDRARRRPPGCAPTGRRQRSGAAGGTDAMGTGASIAGADETHGHTAAMGAAGCKSGRTSSAVVTSLTTETGNLSGR